MEGTTEIDIIILSYAQNSALKTITDQCLASLLVSEDTEKIKFNILVIESEKKIRPYQYAHTTTIYPEEEFGYNRYLNIGLQMTAAKYVCLCNNDLIFHQGWATEILKSFHRYYDLSSASPACSFHHPALGFELGNGIYTGYRSRYEVAGWCLFMKRDIFRLMGKLDGNYKFWCADNDYANMLATLKLGHALVSSAIVDHLDGATLKYQTPERMEELTTSEFFYFEKKWNYRIETRCWKLIS
ncbi:glycosyltransferase family 2 protein [Pedobacter sp. L105]|uniref:glycosyltransferase family 2 protein n=1 Tax=Pedobacter sp. L105 TaxID=1641871 RepID=UPI00131C7D30|nr:glycosyltransferase [Pedobacter sp. L105]